MNVFQKDALITVVFGYGLYLVGGTALLDAVIFWLLFAMFISIPMMYGFQDWFDPFSD